MSKFWSKRKLITKKNLIESQKYDYLTIFNSKKVKGYVLF